MKNIVYYLNTLDLFRRPLYLRIEKQEMTATKFGLFLSFAIYGILVYFLFKSDCFLKEKPKIITQSINIPYSPIINFNDRPFAFAVQDGLGRIYEEPSIFTFDVSLLTKNSSKSAFQFSAQLLKFHHCNDSDDETLNLTGFHCLTPRELTIFGDDDDILTQTLQISLRKCINSTLNSNFCKSDSEISDFFSSKSLNLIYKNPIFQLQSYETPIILKFTSNLYRLDPKLTRSIIYQFQKAFLITEDSTIFSSQETQETWVFDSETTEIGLINSNFEPILVLLVKCSDKMLKQQRSYQSLAEALAILGGLFSFFVLAGKVFSKIEKKIYVTVLLMNNLYSFQQFLPTFNNFNHATQRLMSYMAPKVLQNVENRQFTEKNLKNHGNETLKGQFIEKNVKNHGNEPLKGQFTEKNLKNPGNLLKVEKINFTKKKRNLQEESIRNSINIEQKIVTSLNTSIDSKDNLKIAKKISKTKKKIALFDKNEDFPQNLEDFMDFKSRKHQIIFSIFDYLRLVLKILFRRRKSFKEKLFLRAQDAFYTEIDLVKILQRIQDIEKLKHLLLNDKQISLFDVLEKPIIYVDEKHAKFTKSRNLQRASLKEKMDRAFEYYQELEKKRDLGEIDRKLFNLVDVRFRTYKKYFGGESKKSMQIAK